MPTPLEEALAYLDELEADRQAALALSEQKTEEAKLIKARQEGFRAAMKMLGEDVPVAAAEHDPEEPVRRRARRRIPELITRELSFSGRAMTARQIAKAIDYNLERTESALTRMAESGQVQQSGKDRWVAVATTAQLGVHAVTGGNGAHAPAAGRIAGTDDPVNRVRL
jgi:DNA repair exonuclease SbcCD ATPase subunit